MRLEIPRRHDQENNPEGNGSTTIAEVGGRAETPRFSRRQRNTARMAAALVLAGGAGTAVGLLTSHHAPAKSPAVSGKPSPNHNTGGVLPTASSSHAPGAFQTPTLKPSSPAAENYTLPSDATCTFTKVAAADGKYKITAVPSNFGEANPANFVLSVDEIVGPDPQTNYHSFGLNSSVEVPLTVEADPVAQASANLVPINLLYYENGVPSSSDPNAYSVSYSGSQTPIGNPVEVGCGSAGTNGQ